MQTFLPYPSFARSAAVLDTARLGKQRIETMQILRAVLLPTYGWQRHPVVLMWRGFVPALTAYGLAVTDTWRARGHADTVRDHIVEFAPEVDGVAQEELASAGLLPPWVGDEAVHESHRSRLIAKDPAFYGAAFRGTQEGLEYVWPDPVHPAPEPPPDPLWVLRVEDPASWRDTGLLAIPLLNPAGRLPPAWRQQLQQFEELAPGTVVGVLGPEREVLHLARVSGPAASATLDGVDHLARPARFEGTLSRTALPVPAALQNPRRLFTVAPPAVPAAPPAVPAAAGILGG